MRLPWSKEAPVDSKNLVPLGSSISLTGQRATLTEILGKSSYQPNDVVAVGFGPSYFSVVYLTKRGFEERNKPELRRIYQQLSEWFNTVGGSPLEEYFEDRLCSLMMHDLVVEAVKNKDKPLVKILGGSDGLTRLLLFYDVDLNKRPNQKYLSR
jgi:hypothetical protein